MKKTLKELTTIIGSKNVYIWGAMIVGQGMCRALERHGVTVTAFVDSSPGLQERTALGFRIGPPSEAIEQCLLDNAILIIASGHYDLEIEKYCIQKGLTRDRHYIMSVDLNHVDPSVDVAGTCNLRCISCPQGNMTDLHPKGFMSAEDYGKVLTKLMRELPFLGSIQLYTWGEPMLNRELPDIISRTKKSGVLSALSSNLNVPKGYTDVVKAGLDWFKVSASGFEKSYEVTHTGGNWERFVKNLHKLAALRQTHHPGMQILLNYHVYKHNNGRDYEKMAALCRSLDIIFRPSPAYLYPMDLIRDYTDGVPMPQNARKTIALLYLDLDKGIDHAKKLQSVRCPEDRCLPISWDRKVRFCGVYYRPFICDDFLSMSLSEILEKRKVSLFCRECKARGLHQFTGVYLAEMQMQGSDKGGS